MFVVLSWCHRQLFTCLRMMGLEEQLWHLAKIKIDRDTSEAGVFDPDSWIWKIGSFTKPRETEWRDEVIGLCFCCLYTLLLTPECKQRIDKLVRDFGNSEGKARQGQDDSEDEEYFEEDSLSDEELYRTIKQAVEVDDWVGPIKAHIEFWERGQKRGTMLESCLACGII